MTRVGFWTCSMVHATVALLPDPVMPSSVWYRSPLTMPSLSAATAPGWSPAGSNSDTILKGTFFKAIADRLYRRGVTTPSAGRSTGHGGPQPRGRIANRLVIGLGLGRGRSDDASACPA
jgi:hypothetical protein